MAIIDRIKSALPFNGTNANTKTPNFVVSNFTSQNGWTSLIEEEDNYFDQYILYTYKAIDYISDKVASTDIHVFGEEMEVLDDNNQLMDDLQKFNPYMTLYEARKLKEMHLRLTGAAYWYIDRDPEEGERFEFYPLDPTSMKMKTNNFGLPDYWEYTDGDGVINRLEVEDIMYFRRVDPSNWFQGISQVKQLKFWTNAISLGAQYNMNRLGNDGRPDGFLVYEGISDEQREKVEHQLRQKYQGVKNARRMGVLNAKPEWIPLTSSNKELDYVEGMKMLRQDVLAGFGIPEALIFPSATNANTKDAIKIFQQDTLEPALKQEMAVYNEQLIKRWDGARTGKSTFYFGFENVIDVDKAAMVDQAKKLIESGIFTRNQALEYIGEETVDDGDIYLNNQAPEPLEEEQAEEEVEDTEEEIKRLKSLTDEIMKLKRQSERKEFVKKNIKIADEQEGLIHDVAKGHFHRQAIETIEYVNKNNPTVRGIFDLKDQKAKTKEEFKSVFETILTNSNQIANNEIKTKLLDVSPKKALNYKTKSISPETLNELNKKLEIFADEIDSTSRDKLRKLISQGAQQGFDKTDYRNGIKDIFNGYIDGQGNIDTLTKMGLYEPSIVTGATDNDVIIKSNNRYNAMLENISKAQANGEISKKQADEALRALQGMIDPSDPIGAQVSGLLTNLYGIPEAGKGISDSRVNAIARTEATFIRNLALDDTYRENPFVKAREWNTVTDGRERPAHNAANGQRQPEGEEFSVGGESLKRPGDPSGSAANIVNCRCRLTAVVE